MFHVLQYHLCHTDCGAPKIRTYIHQVSSAASTQCCCRDCTRRYWTVQNFHDKKILLLFCTTLLLAAPCFIVHIEHTTNYYTVIAASLFVEEDAMQGDE